MKNDHYQFFELTRQDTRFKPWERQFFLDRTTGAVYLPAADPEVMLLALMDGNLIHVNGNPYCPLLLYVEKFPHFSAGLLDLEQRVLRAA